MEKQNSYFKIVYLVLICVFLLVGCSGDCGVKDEVSDISVANSKGETGEKVEKRSLLKVQKV